MKTEKTPAAMVAALTTRAMRYLGPKREDVEFIDHGHEALMERASDAFVDLADALKELSGAQTLAERVMYLERVRARCGTVVGIVAVIMDSVDMGLPL